MGIGATLLNIDFFPPISFECLCFQSSLWCLRSLLYTCAYVNRYIDCMPIEDGFNCASQLGLLRGLLEVLLCLVRLHVFCLRGAKCPVTPKLPIWMDGWLADWLDDVWMGLSEHAYHIGPQSNACCYCLHSACRINAEAIISCGLDCMCSYVCYPYGGAAKTRPHLEEIVSVPTHNGFHTD